MPTAMVIHCGGPPEQRRSTSREQVHGHDIAGTVPGHRKLLGMFVASATLEAAEVGGT